MLWEARQYSEAQSMWVGGGGDQLDTDETHLGHKVEGNLRNAWECSSVGSTNEAQGSKPSTT